MKTDSNIYLTMSVCNPCTKTKPVARCITNLTIGAIPQINTPAEVFIANITTGRIVGYFTSSLNDGTVTIPISPQIFSEDHAYEVHITTSDSTGINEKQDITIGEEVAECVELRFEMVWKNDNTAANFVNQTLSTL
ncbi:MAG: hypothetical protein ACHQ1D_00290 [Nitrososphaerales archaeon]